MSDISGGHFDQLLYEHQTSSLSLEVDEITIEVKGEYSINYFCSVRAGKLCKGEFFLQTC
jgi:hypothetical protein